MDPIMAVDHARNKASPFVFAAPALLDCIGSFLNFTALAFISASSYQMLKMLTMVFVFLLSVTVLRRSYAWVQYGALLLVMIGLTVVTLTDIYGTASASTGSNDSALVMMGMICMVFGQFFHAGQVILEEHILKGAAG